MALTEIKDIELDSILAEERGIITASVEGLSRPEWLELREEKYTQNMFGCSDLPAIFGMIGSAHTVYEKCKGMPDTFKGNMFTKAGQFFEDEIGHKGSEVLGVDVYKVPYMLSNFESPYLWASHDFFVRPHGRRFEGYGMECKCVLSPKVKSKLGYNWSQNCQEYWKLQATGQTWSSNLKGVIVAVMMIDQTDMTMFWDSSEGDVGGFQGYTPKEVLDQISYDLKWFVIPRNQTAIDNMLDGVTSFHNSLVNDMQPQVDGSEELASILKNRVKDREGVAEPTQVALVAREQYDSLDKKIKDAKKEQLRHKNVMLGELGDSQEMQGVIKITSYMEKRLDEKAFKEAHPDLAGEFMVTKSRDRVTVL